jgi:repressor LexA
MSENVHNAQHIVKSKRTLKSCFLHIMDYDDRPDPAKRLEQARRARGFDDAKAAATFFGWSYDTYAQHENGTRGIVRAADRYAKAYRVSEGWLLTGEGPGPDQPRDIPIMGFVGAGAEIEPDFDQVPADGLYQISLPFPLPAEMIAFEVKGDSMLPVYKEGFAIVVYREQQRPLESFYGEEAAVRTTDGRRFVKTIQRGSDGCVNLASFNAPLIENVRLEWIGEIFTTMPRRQWKKLDRVGGIQGRLRLATG